MLCSKSNANLYYTSSSNFLSCLNFKLNDYIDYFSIIIFIFMNMFDNFQNIHRLDKHILNA